MQDRCLSWKLIGERLSLIFFTGIFHFPFGLSILYSCVRAKYIAANFLFLQSSFLFENLAVFLNPAD